MNRGRRPSTIAVGIAFGFLVTGSGFGNYATIHQALLLRSWYLFAVFGSAVAVAAAGLALLRRAGTTRYGGPLRLPHGPARRSQVYGAAIFGVGFGLTGTCPGWRGRHGRHRRPGRPARARRLGQRHVAARGDRTPGRGPASEAAADRLPVQPRWR